MRSTLKYVFQRTVKPKSSEVKRQGKGNINEKYKKYYVFHFLKVPKFNSGSTLLFSF
jgi:hypothetical protein